MQKIRLWLVQHSGVRPPPAFPGVEAGVEPFPDGEIQFAAPAAWLNVNDAAFSDTITLQCIAQWGGLPGMPRTQQIIKDPAQSQH